MDASREAILDALRAARAPETPRPEPAVRPVAAEDLRTLFAANLTAAGGQLAVAGADEPGDVLARIPGFAEAQHCWSGIPGIPGRGAALIARSGHDLAGLDFAVLPGELAVAENGAVWQVPASPLERAAAVLAEHLVLVVPARALVATLHEVYARIDPAASDFGWLLSGPSKTADIEQALVFGAHGARATTVVLSESATSA